MKNEWMKRIQNEWKEWFSIWFDKILKYLMMSTFKPNQACVWNPATSVQPLSRHYEGLQRQIHWHIWSDIWLFKGWTPPGYEISCTWIWNRMGEYSLLILCCNENEVKFINCSKLEDLSDALLTGAEKLLETLQCDIA